MVYGWCFIPRIAAGGGPGVTVGWGIPCTDLVHSLITMSIVGQVTVYSKINRPDIVTSRISVKYINGETRNKVGWGDMRKNGIRYKHCISTTLTVDKYIMKIKAMSINDVNCRQDWLKNIIGYRIYLEIDGDTQEFPEHIDWLQSTPFFYRYLYHSQAPTNSTQRNGCFYTSSRYYFPEVKLC